MPGIGAPGCPVIKKWRWIAIDDRCCPLGEWPAGHPLGGQQISLSSRGHLWRAAQGPDPDPYDAPSAKTTSILLLELVLVLVLVLFHPYFCLPRAAKPCSKFIGIYFINIAISSVFLPPPCGQTVLQVHRHLFHS